jgi:hypothetical protein
MCAGKSSTAARKRIVAPVDRSRRGEIIFQSSVKNRRGGSLRRFGSVPGLQAGPGSTRANLLKPAPDQTKVVAGSGEDGIGAAAVASFEVIAAHPVLGLEAPNDRLDSGAAAGLFFFSTLSRAFHDASTRLPLSEGGVQLRFGFDGIRALTDCNRRLAAGRIPSLPMM